MNSPRILIADDHAYLRVGLKQILVEEYPEATFGEAATTAETIQQLHEASWDVLVLDLSMPGRGGIEVLAETRQAFPKLPVLVLSSAPEDQLGPRVLKAGAAGFLNKQTAPEDLVAAVKKVLAGGRYVSATLAELLAADLGRGGAGAPHEMLSDREFEVFQLMAAGSSLKEIASRLSISVKTVSTFRTRVFTKLHVKNDIELARYAMQHGLDVSGK